MADSRTFIEIFNSMPAESKVSLTQKVIKLSMVSDSAFRNWRTGHRTPGLIHQNNIAKVLRTMGIQCSPETLFPR